MQLKEKRLIVLDSERLLSLGNSEPSLNKNGLVERILIGRACSIVRQVLAYLTEKSSVGVFAKSKAELRELLRKSEEELLSRFHMLSRSNTL